MWTVSSAFQSAVTMSHTVQFKFDILQSGLKVATFTGRCTGGRVVDDKKSDRRRRLESLVVGDPILVDTPTTLVPILSTDYLNAYGNEIRPWMSVNGLNEWVPMGTFRILDAKVVDGSGMTITITGEDRSVNISRNTFLTVYAAPLATNMGEVIRGILMDRYPQISFQDTITMWDTVTNAMSPPVSPLLLQDGEDGWSRSRQMAQAVGGDLWFTRMGDVVFQVDPAVLAGNTGSVASLVEGAGCTFSQATREINDQSGFNVVVITGEGSNLTGDSPRGVYWDNDPSSPTYAGPWTNGGTPVASNGYGLSVYRETNTMVQDQGAAVAAAKAKLASSGGPAETIALDTPAWCWLDVDDVITATRQRVGIAGSDWVITNVTTPFSPKEKQTISAVKKRRYT